MKETHTSTCVFSVCYNMCVSHQLNNPDMRVVIIKDFVQSTFPATPLLTYALEVEKITTSKVHSAVTSCIYYVSADVHVHK